MFTATPWSCRCSHVSDIRSWGTQRSVIKRKIINPRSCFSYCCGIWRNLQHTQRRALVFRKEPQSAPLWLYLLCMKTPRAARVSIVKLSWQSSKESCCSTNHIHCLLKGTCRTSSNHPCRRYHGGYMSAFYICSLAEPFCILFSSYAPLTVQIALWNINRSGYINCEKAA